MGDLERIVYLKPGQAYRLSPSESVTLRLDTGQVGDLDKKLEELINEEIGHCCSIPNMSENIDKLKQAFIDAGWQPPVRIERSPAHIYIDGKHVGVSNGDGTVISDDPIKYLGENI